MANANDNDNIVDTITMNNTNDNDCNVKIGTTTPTCLSNAGTVTMANTALAQLAQSTTQYAFTLYSSAGLGWCSSRAFG
jgi:hypothetical protein